MTVLQAVLLGFFSWFLSSNLIGGTVFSQVSNKPLFAAFVCGVILGDMESAMIVGTVLQSMYIGAIAVGGVETMPSIDKVQYFAIPAAMISGGDATVCVTLALALSVINTPLTQIERNIVKVPMVHWQDHLVEKGNLKLAVWGPFWVSTIYDFAVKMILITGLCLAGTDAVVYVVNMLPEWVTEILEIFNGLLPLLGFSLLLLSLIHKYTQLIWFVFGFLLYEILGLSLVSVTLFALAIAYLQYTCQSAKKKEEA